MGMAFQRTASTGNHEDAKLLPQRSQRKATKIAKKVLQATEKKTFGELMWIPPNPALNAGCACYNVITSNDH
jgi:hypothetical protein